MPGGDRSGPLGQGPGTGKKSGFCYGFSSPGFTRGSGRRMGTRFGFGRGFDRQRFHGGWDYEQYHRDFKPGFPWMFSMDKADEIKLLKSQAEALRRSREEIEKRLGDLEKGQ